MVTNRISEKHNDFNECLAISHAASDLPFWEEAYRKAFPSFSSMVDHRKDGFHQRAGIDRSIILENSKQILIDEKVRGRNRRTGIVYPDIALEHVSNNRTRTPGWVCKSLLCDYIAYAIVPHGKCYMLPVPQLQSAWDQNKSEWRRRFGDRKSLNKGYETIFTPVPPGVLFQAIGSALRVQFPAIKDFMDDG